MTAAVEASGLGKAYRRTWALRDCALAVPEGHVVGLVGPNGAGKTTLLRLAAGMLASTCGTITVLGQRPASGPAQLARVGFVAQDTPAYARMRVADHLRLGAWLNPGWDDDLARRRVAQVGLDPKQRAVSLSGGQRAQLALTLALAKRPDLLLLDEPVAGLDPLARREFLRGLMEAVAEHGTSVVLSSHLVTDLERVCDYLIVLVASRVRIADWAGTDWAGPARRAVFGDGSVWRAALRRQSPEALEAGESIARRAAPFRSARLPGADLVHKDFGLHNVLFRNGDVAAVVDLEGVGRGPVAIDVATLLFSVHGRDAAPEPVLARLAAYAVDRDGPAVATVCLASALFDWCVFATSGQEPATVTAYLLKAATLFDRLS